MLVTLLLLVGVSSTLALDNGLALTPPMGWLTWERFRCITDCKKYPNECISENLIKRTADIMVSEGYLDAGYEYLGIDDCWLEKKRGPDGRMVPDKERFPSGMKALADYIHSKGLKFGMYEDYGNLTCAGYPGVLGNERLDIETFVEWEIDYLKLDGCYIQPENMDAGYPAFGQMLNETGRSILYSCSWPAYQEDAKMLPDYASIAQHCNMWRNWDDIEDSWASMTKIMNWFGDNQDRLAKHAGPGHWNDPDMLLIGNFGLTIDQARVQMAVWSILAAPLLMSVDLATIRPEFKEILLNKDVIAVNQDPLGKQGLRVWKKTERGARSRLEVWRRELQGDAQALAFVSQRDDGIPYAANFTSSEMNVQDGLYEVHDLYKDEGVRHWNSNEDFEVRINPSGVKFYKFIRKPSSDVVVKSKTDSDSAMSDAVVYTMLNKS
ncbi:alpha-N-acetylgalactosaminidase [Helicoverpa armigera]|uniref:alpha-N-acetylgalactosaminidase n=1 Tax=Helicoverpa armigera TaxID=29058 RepID=UPI003083AF97